MFPELYTIVFEGVPYYMTSADHQIEFDGHVYTPAPIGRNDMEDKNQISRANIEVKLSIDHVLARSLLSSINETIVSLTILELQNEGEDDEDASVIWKGRLASVKPQKSTITMVYESIFTSLKRPGLRERFHRNCMHVLYGNKCKVPMEDWASPFNVTQSVKDRVYSPDLAAAEANLYVGGIIKAPNGAMRFITGQTQTYITLLRPLDGLPEQLLYSAGIVECTIYPGCDRNRHTCITRFDNLKHNGSFPFIPIRNPFDGSSII